ncbi:dicarboxylate/amino acid:cation symporter [Sphingomicrobium nitratireducens]|uniref:dicarboxylate/amino acid:cation symporter n=1 Tax=Sphingomicrobium nitratireducens TaxID=2964666 RepID=UPI00223F3BBC|nr:cation:dicarboxylase symporter family transporter [Sphingomicrobium nitratireducens]
MMKKLLSLHLAVKVLVALALGTLVGLVLPSPGSNATIDWVVALAAVAGQMWINALQMTILPLVFALLSTTFIRSQGLATGGRVTRRSFALIIALYLLSVVVGLVMVPMMFAISPVTPEIGEALRHMVGNKVATEPLPWADAFLSLIPTNIVSAMAGATLLPVLIFALLFGAAIARLDDGEPRRVVVAALTGIADAVFVIVDWVLRLSPLGVAFLIMPTIQQNGLGIFAGFAQYILMSIAVALVLLAITYVLVAVRGSVPLGRFAHHILSVQAVALGTQSSTGCMPLTIKACKAMGVRDEATDVSVPLAAVLFRIVSPASAVLAAYYGAQVYGIEVGFGLLVAAGLLGMVLEMGLVGIPGAATFIAYYAPIAALVGFPLEFMLVFIVVNVLPDIVFTGLHVTSHASVATMIDRAVVQGAFEKAPAID